MKDKIYNDYERLGEPHEGAFATVYKVRHLKYGYVRALKVLNKSVYSEEDKKFKTFVKECQMLLKVGNGCHPNIVRMFEPRLVGNQAIVEMDYVNGDSLFEYLNKKEKFMSIEEVYRFIRQIGGALAYCHHDIYLDVLDWDEDDLESDRNDPRQPLIDDDKRRELITKYRITHNDLHSGNVMRRYKDGNFYLIDFGLAIQNGIAVKSSGLFLGALEYRSPEKWKNANVKTPQNDIYSFGILMYEVLTGLPPFPVERKSLENMSQEDCDKVMNSHLKETPAPIEPKRKATFEAANPGKTWQRDYPAWLEQMVMKCLAKNPEDRYADAKELMDDFECHLAEDEAARKAPRMESNPQNSSKPDNTDPESLLRGGHSCFYNKNYNEAEKYYRLAAELGNAEAKNQMGLCYQNGWGVAKEATIAAQWYRLAANQGNIAAQYNLGHCYEYGKGVPKSREEAIKWYRKAAVQGNPLAKGALKRLETEGNQPRPPKPTFIQQSQKTKTTTKKAKYIIPAVILLAIFAYLVYGGGGALTNLWKSGNPVADSLCQVGCNYLKGTSDFPQDYNQAVNHFRQADTLGSAEAQNWLGRCYFEGWGVPKDSVEGVAWYRKSADQGFEWGQYNLGICYYYGQGIEQKYKEAAKWYRKAANNDNPNAQNSLGNCYYFGEGVDQNYKEAVKWYRKSADQDYVWAQYNLGNCYYYGKGVDLDYTEATKWYRKSADQELADAQNMLGLCYYEGKGVDQNYAEAVKSYRKSAEQGLADAQNRLGVCYQDGKGVDRSCTEAVKWYRKSADQNYSWAQYNLGKCYFNGNGVDQDYTEAVKWYREAADQGLADAQNRLGVCYYVGKGVDRNYTEAVEWYRKAADQNYAWAQFNLGDCYYNGNGVKQNYNEAMKWYRKSADQGLADAQNMLGRCYKAGWGVPKNLSEAVKWYLKAAGQNLAVAQYNLGLCYEYGEGVAKSRDEAINWYRKAAAQGYTGAKTALKRLGVKE